jgi:hypothetical protein
VGGSSPYFTLFARAGIGRAEADAALAELAIHELPCARGCTYVVPSADYGLALTAGDAFAQDEMKVARKLGVTDAEIAKLSKAVVAALQKGPLDPDALKAKVGDAARNLGPEGVKKGITTTLPVALGLLQAEGSLRRVPVNGRFDQQRYRYALWSPNPRASWRKSPEETYTELARLYFSWIGPATLAEFQWFAGLGVKAAAAAVAPLQLKEVYTGRMLLPDEADRFKKFEAPKRAQYALVASADSLLLLRRELATLLDAKEQALDLLRSKGNVTGDLPSHAILDRGRIVGLWEFDQASGRIEWVSFIPRNRELERAVAQTEEFIVRDLGDARSFSLDSPARRAPRIEALRKAAGA